MQLFGIFFQLNIFQPKNIFFNHTSRRHWKHTNESKLRIFCLTFVGHDLIDREFICFVNTAQESQLFDNRS